MGRYDFYTNQRTLVHDIIMYYLPLLPDQVRLAIVMFSADEAELVVDGIYKEPFNKCDFFSKTGYWDKVIYKTKYTYSEGKYLLADEVTEGTGLEKALMIAKSVFVAGK